MTPSAFACGVCRVRDPTVLETFPMRGDLAQRCDGQHSVRHPDDAEDFVDDPEDLLDADLGRPLGMPPVMTRHQRGR